jgi:hypothetical protein
MIDRYQQYKNNSFDSDPVSDTSMLSEKDIDLIKYALNKEWTNPKFKLKWFVGEQQVTPFAKLRQWLLELRSKEEVLDAQVHDTKTMQLKIKKFKRIIENSTDDIQKEEAEMELVTIEFNLKRNLRRTNDGLLERQHLIDLINEFLESDESKLPDGRSIMDIMGTAEEDALEAHYWTMRLAKQAAMDIQAFGRIGVGNMEAICNLKEQHQSEVLVLAHKYALQLEVHQNVIRQEVAVQLGIPKEAVPGLGVTMSAEAVTKFIERPTDSKEAIVEKKPEEKKENLENVYRI